MKSNINASITQFYLRQKPRVNLVQRI